MKKYDSYFDECTGKKNNLYSILKKVFLVVVFILLGNLFVAKVFRYNLLENTCKEVLKLAGIYTEPIPSITMESDGWKEQEEGSYQIIKSAKWDKRGEGKITIDVNSIASINSDKDIIFILDNSSSMKGEKLERVKETLTEVIGYLFDKKQNNNVALITFNSSSTIISTFTNDKQKIIEGINEIEADGETNYNAGLKNALRVLDGYEYNSNRELVILFLTDGYPSLESPSQVGTYNLIKEKYPFSIINAIQYEMGNDISKEIEDVSDNQFIARKDTLNNILVEASIIPDKYEKFTIIDVINNEYFEVKDKNDIRILENNLEINGIFDLINDNGKQKIVWDLTNYYMSGKEISMEIKIHLKEVYVNTDGLYPTNSELSVESKLPDLNKESHSTKINTPVLSLKYEVIYDTNPPKVCNSIRNVQKERHYVFENVTKKEEKPACNGYIFNGWEVVEDDVIQANEEVFAMPEHEVHVKGVWAKPVISKAMDGTVRRSISLYKVLENEANSGSGFAYKYEGEADDSYTNPEADENIYYYKGAVTTNNVIFGGFCWQMVRTTKTGGVKMIYNGVPSINQRCNNTGNNQQLAKTSRFANSFASPANAGYMFNQNMANTYKYNEAPIYVLILADNYISSTSNYYYSKTIEYVDGEYRLGNDAEMHIWSDFYEEAEGYYTCQNTSTTCKDAYYIAAANDSYQYNIKLSWGNLLEDVDEMVVGTGFSESGGKYILTNTQVIRKRDWYKNYGMYKNLYICGDGKDSSCTKDNLYFFDSIDNYRSKKIDLSKKYGSSFTYDNGVYTLVDAKTYDELGGDLSSHRYSCNNSNESCSTIRYIYNYTWITQFYYFTLKDGKSINDAFNEMFNLNKDSSTIKMYVDKWFGDNLILYKDYLEDVIFCNDRTISDYGSFNPIGSLDKTLYFSAHERNSNNMSTLTCKSKSDSFSVSNPEAQLQYPVGLLSLDEALLARNNNNGPYYLSTGYLYWLGTPDFYEPYYISMYVAGYNGSMYSVDPGYSFGVRPVISLKPGTEYASGYGTPNNPYIVV